MFAETFGGSIFLPVNVCLLSTLLLKRHLLLKYSLLFQQQAGTGDVMEVQRDLRVGPVRISLVALFPFPGVVAVEFFLCHREMADKLSKGIYVVDPVLW